MEKTKRLLMNKKTVMVADTNYDDLADFGKRYLTSNNRESNVLAKLVEKGSIVRYQGSDYRIIEKNKKNIRGKNEIGDETAESLYSCCAIIIFSLSIVNFIVTPLIQYFNSNG